MNALVARSITRNTAVMLGSQGVTWISSLILMMVLPRAVGSENYGRLYLALSLTMIAQVVIDFGAPYFIPKEIARNPGSAPKLLADATAARFLLWAATLVLMTGFSLAAGYPAAVTEIIVILGVGKLWEGASRILRCGYQGIEQMEIPSLASIVERVFLTAAGVTALLLGGGIVAIAYIMAASTLLNYIVCRRFAPRALLAGSGAAEGGGSASVGGAGDGRARTRASLRDGAARLREAAPYFLWTAFAVIYYRVDAVMVSLMAPERITGWYGAAYRFFDILMFLPSIFTVALLPSLARLWERNEESLSWTLEKSLQFILAAGIPISLLVFACSDELIDIFFGGAEFAGAAALLRIFSAGLILVYLDMILGTAIFAADRQREWSIVAFAAIWVNAGLNGLLIPFAQAHAGNGGIGAAWATIITELFVLIATVRLIPAALWRSMPLTAILKTIVAGGAGAAVLAAAGQAGIGRLPAGIAAAAVYCAALISWKTFEKAEVAFVRDFFSGANIRKLFAPKRGTP